MSKIPRVKPFPGGKKWESILKQCSTDWEKDSDFSSNWYHTVGGPRKLMYNTGRDPGGYRGGYEGVYRVLDIIKINEGRFNVKIFNNRYGIIEDRYTEPSGLARKNQGLNLGGWSITGDQAVRALNWQKKAGLFKVT